MNNFIKRLLGKIATLVGAWLDSNWSQRAAAIRKEARDTGGWRLLRDLNVC